MIGRASRRKSSDRCGEVRDRHVMQEADNHARILPAVHTARVDAIFWNCRLTTNRSSTSLYTQIAVGSNATLKEKLPQFGNDGDVAYSGGLDIE